jgi:surfactin synthase thioesterase subunit
MMNINVFFLPFAGGSKYSYNHFVSNAPDYINVIPLELPGRGARYGENLETDANVMVDDLITQMQGLLDMPYAIYGHSMGSLLGYLVTRRLRQQNLPLPKQLIFTGCVAPCTAGRLRKRHLLPKEEFLTELRTLGGSPDEILENESLMQFFEPIIRADFQAIETYRYEETEPLYIPITIVNGDEEIRVNDDVWGWQKESIYQIDARNLPGRHFFIFDHCLEILELIGEKLLGKRALQHAG